MHVKQEDTPDASIPEHKETVTQTSLPPTIEEPSDTNDQSATTPWQSALHWLLNHSFSPSWLPHSLRHPVVGYIIAILLQLIAIFLTLLLVQVYPAFLFSGLLGIMAIALVALNWGAGPSLMATLVGVILLDYLILEPRFSWALDGQSLVAMLLFLLVGLTLSITASRFERTRRSAETLATSLITERTRLEAVIETVPDAISIHDAQGTIVRLNKMGLQNTGLARSQNKLVNAQREFAPRTLSGELLPIDQYPVSRALRGETVSSMEMGFLDPSGQERFASLSAAPLHDAKGNIEGAVVITHDITRLYLSEREAAVRANELEAIFEAITDSVFVFNSKGDILRVNAAARTLFHLDNSPEYYSRRLHEHRYNFAPLDERGRPLPEEKWPLYRVLRGETVTIANGVDIRLRSREGEEYLMNVSGAPMYNKAGAIIGAVCICRDVTEQRQLEKRTQETLNALLAMAEALVLAPGVSSESDLLASSSSDEHASVGLRKVARRMAELTSKVLGCQRVTLSSVDPETQVIYPIAVVGLSPEQEEQWWTEGLQAKARLGEGLDPEQAAHLRANDVLLLDMRQAPFNKLPNLYNVRVALIAPMMVGDQVIGLLSLDYGGMEHEYTREEIALTKAVAKLAALVIERERLLRERADARATELALREANRRMDEFLGMTSHELKTPLTSIKGNTQLTVRQLKNSLQGFQKIHDMLESSERQIRLLDRLVDDLLDISRSQANQLELNATSCDLKEIIRISVEEQRRAWPSRTIKLDMPAQQILPVYVDSDRINQVISNYLTNALKYSAEDRPVHVELQQEAEQVRVSVIDEGAGLSVEEQTHIWERFHRARGVEVLSTPQTSSMMGLGLGLYICKTIIEQHNGSVGVESMPGKGSTFWFTLPLAEQTSASM
ncbi:MAG: ATP-binding protein [Ktedonobacteraceae bacterium]